MIQPTQGVGQPVSAYNNNSLENLNRAQQSGTIADLQRISDEVPQEQDDPVNLTRKADNDSRNGRKPQYECQTCKSRKYVDGSDDPGVSFKTPTALSPQEAASAVRAHEQEHVTHERAQAVAENREIVSQTVILHTAVCPECGNSYISGGTTTTVTKGATESGINRTENYQSHNEDEEAKKVGGVVDAKA